MAYFYDEQAAPFTFVGSEQKIALDKAKVSEFRRQHGMNPDPHAPLVGTPESVANQRALLMDFKRKL